MPTGQPDFLASAASNPTSPSFDSGEDTTRILMGGGANSRAGRWLWATGFEADPLGSGPVNLTSIYGGSGNGSAKIINLIQTATGALNNSIWQGNQCLQIETGGTSGDETVVYKIIPWQNGVGGLECFFNFPFSNPVSCELKLEITRFDVSTYNQGRLILVIGSALSNIKLYYDNNGTRTQILDAVNYFQGDTRTSWHYIKLVYDAINKVYVRAYFDNLLFSLAGIAGYTTSTTLNGDRFAISLKTTSAVIKDVWIDNMILTGDEP